MAFQIIITAGADKRDWTAVHNGHLHIFYSFLGLFLTVSSWQNIGRKQAKMYVIALSSLQI